MIESSSSLSSRKCHLQNANTTAVFLRFEPRLRSHCLTCSLTIRPKFDEAREIKRCVAIAAANIVILDNLL